MKTKGRKRLVSLLALLLTALMLLTLMGCDNKDGKDTEHKNDNPTKTSPSTTASTTASTNATTPLTEDGSDTDTVTTDGSTGESVTHSSTTGESVHTVGSSNQTITTTTTTPTSTTNPTTNPTSTTDNPTSTATNPTVDGDTPTIAVDGATAGPGDTFTVAVRIDNNPGIIGLRVFLEYDATVLELLETAEQDFSGIVYAPMEKMPFIIHWVDAIHPDNDTDGVLTTLTFRVREDAASGVTALTLSYNPQEAFNSAWESVPFATLPGYVNVEG